MITKLANAFSKELVKFIPSKMKEVIKRNRNNLNKDICASHDFCDANMVMDTAFKKVMRRNLKMQSDADLDLWNKAWTLAKLNEFKPITPIEKIKLSGLQFTNTGGGCKALSYDHKYGQILITAENALPVHTDTVSIGFYDVDDNVVGYITNILMSDLITGRYLIQI